MSFAKNTRPRLGVADPLEGRVGQRDEQHQVAAGEPQDVVDHQLRGHAVDEVGEDDHQRPAAQLGRQLGQGQGVVGLFVAVGQVAGPLDQRRHRPAAGARRGEDAGAGGEGEEADPVAGGERHRQPAIDSEMVNLLRVTALCHDIGHGVMSHVSENALRRYDELQELSLEFQDGHPGYRAKLSEIAAVYMIESAGFLKLFEAAKAAARQHDFPPDTIALMQKAIIGAPISSRDAAISGGIGG